MDALQSDAVFGIMQSLRRIFKAIHDYSHEVSIDIRISNAIIRVKKGVAQIVGYIRARETETKPGGRFRLPGRR